MKSYLQRILGIPYDRLVSFAGRNAVQVYEEGKNTEKMFRNHDEVVLRPMSRSQFMAPLDSPHKIFARYPCSLNQSWVEYGDGNQSILTIVYRPEESRRWESGMFPGA